MEVAFHGINTKSAQLYLYGILNTDPLIQSAIQQQKIETVRKT